MRFVVKLLFCLESAKIMVRKPYTFCYLNIEAF